MILFFWQQSPRLRVPILPFIFLAAAFFVQWFLYRRAQRWVRHHFSEARQSWAQHWIRIIFVVTNLPWLAIPVWWFGYGEDRSQLIGYLVDTVAPHLVYPFAAFHIWQVGSGGMVVVTLILDALRFLWRKIHQLYQKSNQDDLVTKSSGLELASEPLLPRDPQCLTPLPTRREFLEAASMVLAASPFMVSTYGAYVAREGYRVEKLRLQYPGLPPELKGVTLVQLTDIHAGMFMDHQRMMEFVQVANRLDPDLIVLTGDFVANSRGYVPLFLSAFRHVQARYGVYAILGNHDLFTNSVLALQDGLHQYNIRLLVNQQESILIRGARLNLMGITYIPQSRHERLADLTFENAMRSLVIKDTTILLSHQPNVFPEAALRQIPLTLSGHTHGGQIKFEFLGQDIAPSRLITNFTAGLYTIGESQLYVSRGVGTTGPPLRLGSVPEITHITLI